jgi:hypothetical protein
MKAQYSILAAGIFLCIFSFGFNGALPDFNGDKNNKIMDFETGSLLDPGLPGTGFEFASPTAVDWNNDGLYDLLVGYNLQTPDSLKFVVFINQGSVGDPKFTGRASDTTCFFLNVKYPGQSTFRHFASLGYHPTAPGDNHRFMGFAPSIFDWNNDGLFDIFLSEGTCDKACGCCGTVCTMLWNRRGIWLLINTGTVGNPEFGKVTNLSYNPFNQGYPGETLTNLEFQGVSLFTQISCNGNFPQATLLDWDSDGIMDINYAVKWADIVFGDTTASGQWKPRTSWVRQDALNSDLSFGHHPLIRDGDFNNDGVNELLSLKGQYSEFWLFVRNPDTTATNLFIRDSLLYKRSVIGWHPKYDIIDYDEDGDMDVLAGWGRGNGEPAQPGIWLYRTPGGTPGTHPFADIQKTGIAMPSGPKTDLFINPNPSSGLTEISWHGRISAKARICLYDIKGNLIDSYKNITAGSITWKGCDRNGNLLPSGVYLIRLSVNNRLIVKQFILMR